MRLEICGAALAVAAGLALGGAMHPNLTGDDRPAGPQIIAGSGAARSPGPYQGGATLASYGGRTPDYVLGTDAKRAMAWTPERDAASASQPQDEQVQRAQDDMPTLSRAAYDADPQPSRSHDYPSLGGPADDQGSPTITG